MMTKRIALVLAYSLATCASLFAAEDGSEKDVFAPENIVAVMNKANDYQLAHPWKETDRNWIRATYYTGVMAFHEATGQRHLLDQAIRWAEKHQWEVGTEKHPANRLTCVQVYLELYFVKHDEAMIAKSRKYMDSRLSLTEPAYKRGWDYIDSLYVGPPAFAMMSKATGDPKYNVYMDRVFWEVADHLYDKDEGLFYRDHKARTEEKSRNGKKVLWSRGNGWIMGGLPRILTYLPKDDADYRRYEDLLKTMAASLKRRQGDDGFWRANLGDSDDFPMPESSGTGFFTYAMAWGINNGVLDKDEYGPVVRHAWKGLCNVVDQQGKVCWGQHVGRGPYEVKREHSHEYVTGTFLLAGSEMLKMAGVKPKKADEETPLAWVRFEKASYIHAGKPYLWLGHGDIELVIDVKPQPGHVLELLWGSKNDTRDAVAIVGGREVKLRSGGYDGFRWLPVPIPKEIKADQYRVTLKQATQPQAFVAGVRLFGKADAGTPPDRKKPAYKITFTAAKVPKPTATSQAFPEMRALWDSNPPPPAKLLSDPAEEAAFRQAARNALAANQAFFRSRRFIDGWLKHADPKTGLIPRNLGRSRDFWNAKDAAADNYPFMVITSAMTDRPLFKGRMHDMLRTETKLTPRIGNMPDDYSFTKQAFLHDKPDLGRIIFGSSEYMKDGLISITEWLGPCPWTDRLRGILDDVWKHAPVETPHGNIPSTSTEVNGEMLQVSCRMYWMTGEKKYLDYALRLGDYYLLGNHHPTRDADRLRLIAHGGEIVSGLCELYVTCQFASPEKKKAYQKPLHEMLDRILEVGTNEHGMVYTSINPKTGRHDNRICDTWGYTYNAYYMVYMVDKTKAYRDAVRKAMAAMNEHYRDYGWEGGSNDGYADSIESCLNLHNREPDASAAEWMDHEIRYMFRRQKPNGVIEGWHGDGNSARTWLLYALWKTQGLTIEPWRADVRFGAVERDGKLYVSLTAGKPWTGRLIFDKARHKENLHLPIDYPRLNQFPEWFTADAAKRYEVRNVTADTQQTVSGKQLQEGFKLELKLGMEVRLEVNPAGLRPVR